MYELTKFVLRSLSNLHSESFLNSLFIERNHLVATRSATRSLLQVPRVRTRLQKSSLKYRGAVLFNLFSDNSLIPDNYRTFTTGQLKSFIHCFADNYILQNIDLIDSIFI